MTGLHFSWRILMLFLKIMVMRLHILKIVDNMNSYDFYIVSSSIVCCETEIEAIKNKSLNNKPIF